MSAFRVSACAVSMSEKSLTSTSTIAGVEMCRNRRSTKFGFVRMNASIYAIDEIVLRGSRLDRSTTIFVRQCRSQWVHDYHNRYDYH